MARFYAALCLSKDAQEKACSTFVGPLKCQGRRLANLAYRRVHRISNDTCLVAVCLPNPDLFWKACNPADAEDDR